MQLCISKNNKVWHKLQGRSRKVGVARVATEILQVSANGMEVSLFVCLFSSLNHHFFVYRLKFSVPMTPPIMGPVPLPNMTASICMLAIRTTTFLVATGRGTSM